MSKNPLQRPKKRNVVRWDDNLDELLLLTIRSVCDSNNIKIPWHEVARVMGHRTTPGGIVQHLDKLRQRRLQARKPVPPPLKRAKNHRNQEGQDSDDTSDEEWIGGRALARRKAGPKRKMPRTKKIEVPDTDYKDESDDSNGELLAAGASFLSLPNDRVRGESSSTLAAEPARKKIVKFQGPTVKRVLERFEAEKLGASNVPVKVEEQRHIPTDNYDLGFFDLDFPKNDYVGAPSGDGFYQQHDLDPHYMLQSLVDFDPELQMSPQEQIYHDTLAGGVNFDTPVWFDAPGQ
ncbi:hypothetical protein BJX61DRAFT_544207 [Aspergillus egyptiacus]|nr:hypothetical protein BJX61DRAFT_544207 [Aspergillus egyptiacus]